MGLDILVIPHATLLPEHAFGDDCWDQEHIHVALPHPSMIRSVAGAQVGRCYAVEDGETWDFRAGSYSGYGAFREALCEAANGISIHEIWENELAHVNTPFFELLNFSDCEGVIGPVAAANLAQDFDEARDRVLAAFSQVGDGDWYAERYELWGTACHECADHGLIVFG